MMIGALRRLCVVLAVALCARAARADSFTTLNPAGTPPSARIGQSAVRDAAGNRVVVFAGGTISLQQIPVFVPSADLAVMSLTPGSESWSTLGLPSPPTARMFHSAIYDPTRNRMLVYGGLGSSINSFADLWELSLTAGSEAWRLMAPTGATVPGARFGHFATYVPTLDAMVMYGGYSSIFAPPTSELWTLSLAVGDGVWSLEPAGSGPPTGAHEIAFDPVAQRLLLFGVGDLVGNTSTNDVYSRSLPFATTSWVKLAPPSPLPAPRQGFAMVLDATTTPGKARWLIFSGGVLDLATKSTGEYPGDAYVLDATVGAERWDALVASPSLTRTAMWTAVHDTTANRVVFFGGRDGQGDLNKTYALTLGASYASKLLSVTPSRGDVGQSLNVTLVGTGTAWTGGSGVGFGPEITVNRFTVTGPAQATANVTIQAGALNGARNVGVITGNVADTAIGAFTVDRRPRNILVGSGLADPNPNTGAVYDAQGAPQQTAITAYAAGHWGLNVGAGDIDGDGNDEVLTGPGPGASLGPQVRAFERDDTPLAKANYFAYGTLKYGCGVSSGATDADAFDEILTGAGAGVVFGPHVRGWNYDATSIAAISKINFFAYSTLKYGVKPVTADDDADGYDEIVTAPGPGSNFGPQIHGYNVDGGSTTAMKINFFAFSGVSYGASVAGGDVDADDFGEIVVAKGPGATASYDSAVLGFDYDGAAISATPGLGFTAFPASQLYGARVGAGSIFLRFGDEMLVGGGPDPAAAPDVREYGYDAASTSVTFLGQFATFSGQKYGVNVVSAALGF